MINVIEIFNEKFFDWKDKIDIRYFRALKKVAPLKRIDVVFVEGAISTESEVRKLKEIREKAGKLIAIGSGAINGWPSNLRNGFKGEKKKEVEVLMKKLGQIEKVLPLKDFVRVDDEVVGCPIDEKIFIEKMEGLLNA